MGGHVKHNTALGSLTSIDLSVPQLSQEHDFNYAMQKLGQPASKKQQLGSRRDTMDLDLPLLAQQGQSSSSASSNEVPCLRHGVMDLTMPQLSHEQVDELFAFNNYRR